ncbi:MAG TPA: DUF418 domain-containing protein [Planctomycetota bacterium]|nr:DUF418 domain-containing protein [Planctomycetota bacterium]
MSDIPRDAPAAAVPSPAPTPGGERIASIDAVRGLAVLGILVMNVVEFAWPEGAYSNPAYAGGDAGADLWTYFLQVTLFDGKMRALFSMLFGAGLVLIAGRMHDKGCGANTADLLLRRCLWLVPFGIVHRFFLQWTGDILYQYGLLGLIAIAFRNLRPRTLLALGVATLAAFVPIGLRHHHQASELRARAVEAAQLQASHDEVPEALAAAQRRWQAREESIPPKPEMLQKEIDEVRVGYVQLMRNRWDYHHTFQSSYLYYYFVFDVLGAMFLGMALLKLGFFQGRCSSRVYGAVIAAGGLVAAGQLAWAIAWQHTGFRATALELRLVQDLSYPFSRAIVGLAWAAALLLILRAGRLARLTAALTSVGRMAFSCYVLQTVCCSLLFYGYGLALYGTVPRATLLLVVLAVSIVQIVFCSLWQRAFLFGPLEWAWRSLTYWRRQPLRRTPA